MPNEKVTLGLGQWSSQMEAARLDERMTILDRCGAIDTGTQIDGQLYVPFSAVLNAIDPAHFPID